MTQKKTSDEIQVTETKPKDDEKLKSKGSGKKNKAETEKEAIQSGKVENSNMSLAPVAIAVSIVALLVSIMFAVFSMSGSHDGGTPGKQQLNLTSKLDSSLAFISHRIDKIEDKIAESNLAEKAEREKREVIEIKKALLIFQEARSFISDDEIVKKILQIEEDVKSTLALFEGKEASGQLTTQTDEKPVFGERELEENIEEPKIGTGEEGEKTGEVEVMESTLKIAGPESGEGNAATEIKENETELHSPGMEEMADEEIIGETTGAPSGSTEDEIPLRE